MPMYIRTFFLRYQNQLNWLRSDCIIIAIIHQGKILPMICFYATRHNQQVYGTLDAYYERLGVVGSPFSETINYNGRSNVTISVSSSSLAYNKVLMHISFIPNEKLFFYLSEVEFFSLSYRSDATTNSFLVQGIS